MEQQPNVDEEIVKKLLKYQVQHVDNLVYSLKTYNRALDASDTGTGKTFTASATAQQLKMRPFIICPKAVVPAWWDVMKNFDIEPYGVANYELLHNCRHYPTSDLVRDTLPFLTQVVTDKKKKEQDDAIKKEKKVSKKVKMLVKQIKDERVGRGKGPAASQHRKKKENKTYSFKWDPPKDCLFIFDEAHRCKNRETTTSLLLSTLADTPAKILLLSATVADTKDNFVITGYTLGLYATIRQAKRWIMSVGHEFENPMQGVHNEMYPEYASRMRIRDLKGEFPDNQVIADCYDMECAEEIQKMYKIIEEAEEDLKKKEQNSKGLGKIVRCRQRIENLKIPTYLKMAREFLQEGAAVAIFVNFTETLRNLAEQLKTACVIFGEQTMDERKKNIDDFQADRERVIICNIQAGGVGISLHDTHGEYPRVSIISPSWSAQNVLQAIGRIHRAKTKTPVRQRIVYCKDTVEEQICKNMRIKIVNIASLNDGDTKSYKIEGLIDYDIDKQEKEKSEFEILYQKLVTSHAKRERLRTDLKEVETEITEMEKMLGGMIG